MFNFEYYAPTRVIFGRDAEQRTGALLRELGVSRVLIHYGGGSAVKSGLLDRVSASLDGAGIAHTALGGGGSDANVYNLKGVETVVLGTGMTKVHTTSESIKIANLNDTARLALALLTM